MLEAYGADSKIDAQLYGPVKGGRHIIAMDPAPDVRTEPGARRRMRVFGIPQGAAKSRGIRAPARKGGHRHGRGAAVRPAGGVADRPGSRGGVADGG